MVFYSNILCNVTATYIKVSCRQGITDLLLMYLNDNYSVFYIVFRVQLYTCGDLQRIRQLLAAKQDRGIKII